MRVSYKRLLKSILNVGLCASIGITAVVAGTAATANAATAKSKELINYGEKYIGTPYLYGAVPYMTNAFDCSSFTQYVFDNFDITLPRTSIDQALKGQKVAKGYLSMGDLVFFKTNGYGISHVAIYAGNNKILHSANDGVEISDMDSNYWSSKYVTARRVLN
ncbi:C40 family peptidase [Paenibacillus sp. MWE-103]|uniref:C40 family peptidase n=1 Tax=Paenibacillus artemisiicola TaxID=1172618 RepID=A0ABS3W2V8_9BACL|nr:C40 family peptidase [Paenibacillus artemisiicola]MBO7742642.1 C40 family peptidase [Paenibacillus artemisiicola]SFI35376.1 NlpC/P60 family protein [Paenibacillus sp. UNC496MF]